MKAALFFLLIFAALTLLLPMAAIGVPLALPDAPPAAGGPGSSSSEAGLPGLPAAPEENAEDAPPAQTQSSAPAVSAAPAHAGEFRRESFRILDRTTGEVKEVPLADYLRGALASEMPASFHSEAMAAQAVAAHSYALYCARAQEANPDPALKGADFSADPSKDEGYITEAQAKERYGANFDLYWPKICAAAEIAEHHILLYGGEPILAAYHSTSAGETESAANVWEHGLDYLVPVESEGDLLAPQYQTTVTLTKDEMEKRLTAAFPEAELPASPGAWLVPVERSEGGYITEIKVGDQAVHGKEVRAALGLRSSCFEAVYANGAFTLTVNGYGHGVGLSQYGADFMARQGSDYVDILAHYYPGTTLAEI